MLLSEAQRLLYKELKGYTSNISLEITTILEFILQLSCEEIHALPKTFVLSDEEQKILKATIKRRQKEEPLAYITGQVEFCGYKILVNKHVLIPRPETEQLAQISVERMIANTRKEISILEVGTGSGCISCYLCGELSKRDIPFSFIGIDTSHKATELTLKNLHANNLSMHIKNRDIVILNTSLIEIGWKAHTQRGFIISNPPYIPSGKLRKLSKSVSQYEPYRALDGGGDGLNVYKEILNYVKRFKKKPELYLESDPLINKKLKQLIEERGYQVRMKNDLFEEERFLIAKNSSWE